MSTLRSVVARAAVVSDAIIDADVVATVRAAAQMAMKQAPFTLPELQPTPVHTIDVFVELVDGVIAVDVAVSAVTEVALESFVLFAASTAAVALIDASGGTIRGVEITEAKGGIEAYADTIEGARAVVLVLSDTVAAGKKPDTAGRSVADTLGDAGFEIAGYEVFSDEPSELDARLDHWLAQSVELIITVGGTGIGPRDKAVETVQPRLTTELPGVMEAARTYGQARTPYSALSRGVAGRIGDTFVVTFPGSRKGAEETLEALLVTLIHMIEVHRKTHPHKDGYQ